VSPEKEPVTPGVPTPSPPGLLPFPFSLVLFGGYRRISKKNVLEHGARQTIHRVIARNPGIDVSTLVEVTGINENTLRYHLFKLVAAGKITCFTRPSVVRYFLNQGAYAPAEQVIWHYLWSDTPRRILLQLSSHPGLTRQQIADAIGISGPSVTRQMEHLIDDHVVENRFPGHSNHYYLTAEAVTILSRAGSFQPSILQGGPIKGDPYPHPREARSDLSAVLSTGIPRIPGM
jgi:predicted transcriptional regulator